MNKKFKATVIILVFTALCILRFVATHISGNAEKTGILI